MNTCDFLLERGVATDVAIIEHDRPWTYGQLREAVATVAGRIQSLGLPAGSAVLVVGENSVFWIASYLAVMKLNLVAVPLSGRLSAQNLMSKMRWLGAGTILLDRQSQRRLELDPWVTTITDEVLDSESPDYWPQTATDSASDAVLMFTSGSTAAPKAVRVTHANLQANTDSIVEYLALTKEDRMLAVLQFFYCFGASLLHTHLRAGGSIVLCNSFAFPETAVEALRRHECTGLAGVPSTFTVLLRRSSYASSDLPHLRLVQQAGGRLPKPLIQELVTAHPRARVYVMYGQTEATARLSYLPPERLSDKLGSIGRGIPGVELQVRGADGMPVLPGEAGEIWARGANVSPGYYRDEVATAGRFTDGWLRTGDLATVDVDGYIYIVDRKEDFIKSWGHRVSALEVEECALNMPEVAGAASVGVPDEVAGEAIVLFVELRTQDAGIGDRLRIHLREHLPRHMVPSEIHVVDRIPLNQNGKINRPGLRQTAVLQATREKDV